MLTLLEGLRPKEGVVIFPEGTRFTAKRQEHIIQRFREGGNEEAAMPLAAYVLLTLLFSVGLVMILAGIFNPGAAQAQADDQCAEPRRAAGLPPCQRRLRPAQRGANV